MSLTCSSVDVDSTAEPRECLSAGDDERCRGAQIFVAQLSALLTHSRYFLTLRSKQGAYHPLILFRLSSSIVGGLDEAPQLYAMEAACPHLGADMSHADIEECETGVIAVCPWHRYDFDLRTGESEMGLKACTYAVEIRNDMDGGGKQVFVETPVGGDGWTLVELRPVSEEFADPPLTVLSSPRILQHPNEMDPIVPLQNPPTTLIQWAVQILNTPHPTLKVERTRHAVHLFRTGQLKSIGHKSPNAPLPPDVPPREQSFLTNIVDPGKMKKRKNRAFMLHALANIEQWAIDLAWDIIARFGPTNHDLPPAFFSDFTKMALDESKHFTLLTSRLSATSPETPYGSLPTHASLWASATATATSLRARLAIIHLVHEARGLDVNPGTIARFRRAGDEETAKMMEVVHADEVTHVTTGHRWFSWVCSREGEMDVVRAFREEVRRGWHGDVKGPFNVDDRGKAGMTVEFYEGLRGEMGDVDVRKGGSKEKEAVGHGCMGAPTVLPVEYEK